MQSNDKKFGRKTFSRMRKQWLPETSPSTFFMFVLIVSKKRRVQFQLLKNSQVQNNFKLNEKNRVITYTKRANRMRYSVVRSIISGLILELFY